MQLCFGSSLQFILHFEISKLDGKVCELKIDLEQTTTAVQVGYSMKTNQKKKKRKRRTNRMIRA